MPILEIVVIYLKNPNSRISEKSSTRMTSVMSSDGDLSRTEWTDRSSTDHASLWKQIITDVGGMLETAGYRSSDLHLKFYFIVIHSYFFIKLKLG
jgi:hypothetical protein